MTKVWMAAALLVAPLFVPPAMAADSETTAETPKKEKLICRVDRATGSRVRVNRVCLTRVQWDELADKKRQSLDAMGRSGSISPCGATSLPQGGCGGQ